MEVSCRGRYFSSVTENMNTVEAELEVVGRPSTGNVRDTNRYASLNENHINRAADIGHSGEIPNVR